MGWLADMFVGAEGVEKGPSLDFHVVVTGTGDLGPLVMDLALTAGCERTAAGTLVVRRVLV